MQDTGSFASPTPSSSMMMTSSRRSPSPARRGPLPPVFVAKNVVGIRREDKSVWERRVPLTPLHVAKLVALGIRVIVQPSTKRIFGDDEYRHVGAVLDDDLVRVF